MKKIKLTQNKYALIDDEDFDRVNQYKWHAVRSKNKITFYARRENQFLHQFILGSTGIDHKNGNGLDNQKSNLRKATKSQNQCNRGKNKNNTTGYKGVKFDKPRNKFRARICINNKTIFLGRFDTSEQAAKAYNEAAKIHHGEFAVLNFQ